MIEYLIFENEDLCFKCIQSVKDKGVQPLVDFPVKFQDSDKKDYFLFVVLEDIKEVLDEKYKLELLVEIPKDLQPSEPN